MRRALLGVGFSFLSFLALHSGCASDAPRDVGASDAGNTSEADSGQSDTAAPKKDATPVVVDAGVCPPECDPYAASGSGDSTCPIGYSWTGKVCLLLKGCLGCVGDDCKKLMKYDECQTLALKCANECPI